MKTSLSLSILLFSLSVALGCGESGSSGTAGSPGTGGAGGEGGAGGVGGAGGIGGEAGAGGEDGGLKSNCHSSVPERLSDWALFADIRNQVPAEGVVPFEVTSPLFTDYALKRRFVTLRDGGTLTYTDDDRWQSPVGTIYAKTFAYPPNDEDPESDGGEQLIETRLLVHVAAEDDRLGCNGEESCWNVHVYVYEDDMTDAVCQAGGAAVSVTYTDPVDQQQKSVPDYAVPSNGACRQCHGEFPTTRSLGPSTGMLNRGNDYGGVVVENQIDELFALGMLAPEPPAAEERTTFVDGAVDDTADLHDRARSWLDSNCSHCHQALEKGGLVSDKGLFVDYVNMEPPTGGTLQERQLVYRSWGVCKGATSAGNVPNCFGMDQDIIPGDPDNSLMVCRIESVRAAEMMAPLGRSLVHVEGAALLRQWIAELPTLFPDMQSCTAGTTE